MVRVTGRSRVLTPPHSRILELFVIYRYKCNIKLPVRQCATPVTTNNMRERQKKPSAGMEITEAMCGGTF